MIQGMIQKKLLDAKNRFCRGFIIQAFDKAWEEIGRRRADRATMDIQRHFRAHYARKSRGKEVATFGQKMQEARVHNAAINIQRLVRGYLVRRKHAKYNRAASKIQGFFRMVWLKTYLKTLKVNVPKIQKAFRRFVIRNKQIKEGMKTFSKEFETYNESISKLEHNILFSDLGANTPQINVNDYTKLPFKIENASDFGKSNYKTFMPEPPNIEIAPKVKFVSLLIDLDINVDTTNMYPNTWSNEFNQFIKRIHAKGSRLLHLEVGDNFTLAVTDDKEIYSWGLNDYNQCARGAQGSFSLSQNIVKNLTANPVRMVSVGKDHTLYLDEGNNLYSWGKNSEGQLGLGHARQTEAINVLTYLSKDPIKLISAKQGVNFVATREGKVWTWPAADGESHTLSPVELYISKNFKVANIDVGCDFAMFLDTNGLLYSMGKNIYGELGIGNREPCPKPVLIKSLKDMNEKIVEVSCGLRHTVARSALNKVFTWGYNKDYQLGLEDNKARNVPTKLGIPEFKNFRFKPRSVQASLNGGYILLDDRSLYYFGKTGKYNGPAKVPTKFNYEEKFFENRMADDFTPLRVYCKSSNTLTATYILFLDFRNYAESKTTREKFAEKVNLAWSAEERLVLPPGDDILAKHISSKYLEKPVKVSKPITTHMGSPPPPKVMTSIVEINHEQMKSSNVKNKPTSKGSKTPNKKLQSKEAIVESQLEETKVSRINESKADKRGKSPASALGAKTPKIKGKLVESVIQNGLQESAVNAQSKKLGDSALAKDIDSLKKEMKSMGKNVELNRKKIKS